MEWILYQIGRFKQPDVARRAERARMKPPAEAGATFHTVVSQLQVLDSLLVRQARQAEIASAYGELERRLALWLQFS